MTNTIIWTPNLYENNGQNIVTKEVARCTQGSLILEYPSGSFGLKFWVIYLYNFLRAFSTSGACIYLVISRSRLGFLRDLPVLFLKYFRRDIVVHCHGSDILILLDDQIFGSLVAYLLKDLIFIVPSDHLVLELRKFGFLKLKVIENFCTNVSSIDYYARNQKSSVVILWNSNIMRSKGIFLICKVMKHLGRDFKLRIFGLPIPEENDTKASLHEELKRYASEDNIDYFGGVSQKEMDEELMECDIVTLPSNYKSECQPLAIISAMCAGKRIILLDTPALRATAGNYPVIFLFNEDEKTIHKAVKKCLTIPPYDLQRGAEEARVRFSKRKFYEKIDGTLGQRPLSI